MKNDHFYVYSYRDMSTNTPFYIGKGTRNRYRDIESRKYNLHLYNKIRKQQQAGYNISDFTIIERDNMTAVDALLHEAFLIKKWGRMDLGMGPLLNLTDGGDGVINIKCNPVLILEKDNIFSLYYNQGKTMSEIANIYNCKSISPVRYIFQLFKAPCRAGGRQKPNIDQETLKKDYLEGKSINQLALTYKCDHGYIKNLLNSQSLIIKDGRAVSHIRGRLHKYKLLNNQKDILNLYSNEQKSMEYISKIYKTSATAIRSILQLNNIVIRSNIEAQRIRRLQ